MMFFYTLLLIIMPSYHIMAMALIMVCVVVWEWCTNSGGIKVKKYSNMIFGHFAPVSKKRQVLLPGFKLRSVVE